VHRNVARVASALGVAGLHTQIREFEISTRTARDAAAALGCPVGAIANSLVFVSDAIAILVLSSGAHRVDTELLASVIGATDVRPATPDEVRLATGQPIGGVAPVGHPHPLPTYIDTALRQFETIWASAGSPHAVFPSKFAELQRVTGATEVTVARAEVTSPGKDV
jgi:prolyl-tRNA editing enzyme YbaK/EbsC (Cys-tRNA(Pro) deacylase)